MQQAHTRRSCVKMISRRTYATVLFFFFKVFRSVHSRRYLFKNGGTQWRSWLRHCAKSRKIAGSIPDGVIGFFFIDIILPAALWPWGRLSLYRNEYQECLLGVKVAGAQGRQPYHLHVPTVLKSVSLSLVEPSGPVQACNGMALPLPLPLQVYQLNAHIC